MTVFYKSPLTKSNGNFVKLLSQGMADSEQCSALPCPCQCQGKIRAPKEKEKKLRFKPITCQPRSSQSLQGKHPPGSSPPAKVSNASKEWRCQGKAQAAANAGNQRLPPV